MSSEGEQPVKLISSDNVEIVTGMRPFLFLNILMSHEADSLTERKIAERSMLIKNMIEDLGAPGEEPIPIMNVSDLSSPTIAVQN
jgi:S-phase kinase-associated protein 1